MQPAVVVKLLLPLSALLCLGSFATATADDTNSTSGTNTSCTPARCGNLSITYPFSLVGVQPLYCGFPTLGLTCDANRNTYLTRTFKENLYRVHDIFYGNNSLVVSVEATFAGDDECRVPDFEVSSSLALLPVNISTANKNLTFVYNCNVPSRLRLQPACSNHSYQTTTLGAYTSDDDAEQLHGLKNCSSVSVPVRWIEHKMDPARVNVNHSYVELIREGFLLEWPQMSTADCDACTERGGECRFVGYSFHCICRDGRPCRRSRGGATAPASAPLPPPVDDTNRTTTSSSNTSCTPARCGDLSITYPFSLVGVQPLYCGFPALGLTCDANRTTYLTRTFRENLYRVHDIFYGNNSVVVSVEATFVFDDGCRVPDFNVSASLALLPFNISATNKILTFVFNCNVPSRLRLQPACSNHSYQSALGAYTSDDDAEQLHGLNKNCSSVSVPAVRWIERKMEPASLNHSYVELIREGFLLEWPQMSTADCAACTERGGECRFVENSSFQCICRDGRPCRPSRGNQRLLTSTISYYFQCQLQQNT